MKALNLDSLLNSFPLLLRTCNRLLAHDATTPVTLRLLVFIRVAFFDGGDELGEFGLVFGFDFCEGQDCCCLYRTSIISLIQPIVDSADSRGRFSKRYFRYEKAEVRDIVRSERLTFLCTTVPNLAFPLIIAYGTPIFLHSAGRKITNSIGSTSFGINTNAAFLFSINPTT